MKRFAVILNVFFLNNLLLRNDKCQSEISNDKKHVNLPLFVKRSILSKRPSTFDRSESRSNGVAKP